MKQNLTEEIKKFKLLSKYSTKNTLTENFDVLNEDEKTQVIKDVEHVLTSVRVLDSDYQKILNTVKIVDSDANEIKTVQDLKKAINNGKLEVEELKKIRKYLINFSQDDNLVKELMIKMVKSQGFRDKYSKLSEAEAISELVSKGYANPRRIVREYENTGGKFKEGIAKLKAIEIEDKIKGDPKLNLKWSSLTDAQKQKLTDYVNTLTKNGTATDEEMVKKSMELLNSMAKKDPKLVPMVGKLGGLFMKLITTKEGWGIIILVFTIGCYLGWWTLGDAFSGLLNQLKKSSPSDNTPPPPSDSDGGDNSGGYSGGNPMN